MDPTTTLFTFMLQTHPSVQVVHLVGSWDNFSGTYSMDRDTRRDQGQWRGCHSFKNIICDGDGGSSPRRDGGLKMGQTYYYYYELDGSTETFDSSLPTTTACPYLPGQTVNTLWVPLEHPARRRSASLNSMMEADLKTMNPDDKFTNPRPAVPASPPAADPRRLGSAPLALRHKRSARSLSPGSSWSFSPRRLFSRMASSPSLHQDHDLQTPPLSRSATPSGDGRSMTSYEGSRSRDLSPDSLRRFLVDDTPVAAAEPDANEQPSISIPEDIAEEDEEDDEDDNFATSATSETAPLTILSPPPNQRSHTPSPATTPVPAGDVLAPISAAEPAPPSAPTRTPPRIPPSPIVQISQATSPSSLAGTSFFTPNSPSSPTLNEPPSFYYSEDEDEEDDEPASATEDDWFAASAEGMGGLSKEDSVAVPRRNIDIDATLSTYSLPRTAVGGDSNKLSVEPPRTTPLGNLGSPALVARNDNDVPVGNTSLLTNPIPNSGLDELVSELGWMADIINGKQS